MTVRELIEALGKFDGDLPVYLPYSEGGVDDVKKVEPVTVERGYRERMGFHYYGDHSEPVFDSDAEEPVTPGIKVSA